MGAMINVVYDSTQIDTDSISLLADNLPRIVSEAMQEDDVFLYVTQPEIIVNADPVEIFIQLNSNKIPDPEALLASISERLSQLKIQLNLQQSLNLNIVPVDWHSKVGI